MTKEKQLEYRLAMVLDDINKLIEFIDENRLMEQFDRPTKYSDSAWSHIINIEIACDLQSDDSLGWKKFS